MGGMIFAPGSLADSLSELAGYKAGLALSIEEICDHLSGTKYPDTIRDSEERTVRLRSEEYEAVFYKLLYRIGYTTEEYDGDHTGISRFHKYRRVGLLDEYNAMLNIFLKMWEQLIEETTTKGSKSIDPTPFLIACHRKLGDVGLKMAIEQIEVMHRASTLNPHSSVQGVEWTTALELRKLFSGTDETPHGGKFIDQRFIDYLSSNSERLPEMHWRKFEQLTAEFFQRDGYEVQLGPGRNDDGVDVRVWKPDAAPSDRPLCLVQCKRQKDKIDRVIVKGLYADVQFEGAEYGVVVTSSELSPAARTTIEARGYPIQAVEREAVGGWLQQLRTPGTGIVRL